MPRSLQRESVELREYFGCGRVILSAPRPVEVADDSLTVENRHAAQLLDVALFQAGALEIRVSDSAPGQARILEEGFREHAPPIGTRESEAAVALPARIPQAGKIGLGHAPVTGGLVPGGLANGNDSRAPFLEFRKMTLHLDQALATDRSTEVAQEDENERSGAPEPGQREFAIAFTEEDDVRGPLADRQIHGGQR